MGLDTVKLVVAFEKHFQIAIPDPEVKNIGTVGEAAACVTRLKCLSPDPARTAVYYTVLKQVCNCIRPKFQTVEDTMLLGTFRHSRTLLAQLVICLRLKVPQLASLRPPSSGWLQWLLNSGPTPLDWSKYTVADLTEWIVAQNHARLLPAPATLYEVQRATVGITSYQSGIAVPEIQLNDSFTNDLGID
ncbi:hypothetical protein [uncultured Hymenobacter sp.]|uniref:hypothetical protein n=1 Tax=uncultured Hymenobacter sp. TaxID=170016 RepID=UPI0035C965CC